MTYPVPVREERKRRGEREEEEERKGEEEENWERLSPWMRPNFVLEIFLIDSKESHKNKFSKEKKKKGREA